MSFLYFAYGSNMLPARLKARCKSAKVIGTASASNHALEFSKRSLDNSGKATLIRASEEGIHTPGVVFEIAKTELNDLDSAEGAGYERHEKFEIRLTDNDEKIVTATYLAHQTEAHLKPYDWYLALIIAGVDYHRLDSAHIQRLREIAYDADPDHSRKGRVQALAALTEHGFEDHNLLFKGK